jgi:Alw26I/Eco31I/Esp3I family type II restriction m6 adenine DNA methyltransferase
MGEFTFLNIRYEQAIWDDKNKTEGKPVKRAIEIADIEALKSFHWGFVFDEILNKKGGFDAIITNPPWEIFKPNAKEFFEEFSDLVTRKKMTIKEFEKEQAKLLKDPDIRKAWLEYLSTYPHVSAFFRCAPQYRNQISMIDGKKAGTDINLYKLFTEQCYNLIRSGGYCGIVIPSGIYTDLGAKQLREMLFNQTKITSLFCFENRKGIFENVDSRFKFVVLSFEKGETTKDFPAAFMRHDVAELECFPSEGSVSVNINVIRKLSPTSLSIPEFKSSLDIAIAVKLLDMPSLNNSDRGWGLELYGEELNMTRSAGCFKTTKTRWPVFEGGMIWHFDSHYSEPRYWINETDLRKSFTEKRVKRIGFIDKPPKDIKNDYETYRLAIRKIASNTNERTLITTVIAPGSFAGNSLSVHFPFKNEPDCYNDLQLTANELLVLTSLLNSFVVDWILRARMTTNLNLFYLYQLPIPRLTEKDAAFWPIVKRSARLICTTPEFDDLAKEVGLKSYKEGATDPIERGKLRAELDGIVAHLYGLTEEEFAYILTTFPIVPDPVKIAAHNAFRNVEKGLIK